MDTNSLKKIIENNVNYRGMYNIFGRNYEMPLETVDLNASMIEVNIKLYQAYI